MTSKMLFFDYRENEKSFFKENKFENFEIEFFEEALNEEALEKLSDEIFEHTKIISVFISSEVTENIINRFKNLRVIATRSTGYDHIDINSCVNKNISVVNVTNYGNKSVAQFTLTLFFMLIRNMKQLLFYQNKYFTGHNIDSLTIGIIGTGSIGSSVAKMSALLGANVLLFDVRENSDLIGVENIKYVDFDTLITTSDVISLHLPYTFDNYQMLGEKQFEMMKNSVYIVNVARGELIDNNALLKYIKSGKIKGAALDVVACDVDNDFNTRERTSVDCPKISNVVNELENCDNVIITPHIAYDTQESVDYILIKSFEAISDCLQGGYSYRVV